jgi:hypothetical protein
MVNDQRLVRIDNQVVRHARHAIADFQADEDGLGPLDGLDTIEINDLGTYFKDLRRRVG